MGTVAASWEAKTSSPERVPAAFAPALAQVRSPAGAIVFASGSLSAELETIGRAIAGQGARVPLVVVAAGGVLTERGEIEDQSAAAGVIWAGGRTEIVDIIPGEDDDV